MARTKKQQTEPIFTWAFRSSQPRGGTFITYETRLEEGGNLRCNCPGWVFCRGEKSCKHTKQVGDEAEEILRKFRAGEQLPTFEDPDAPTTGPAGAAIPNPNADHSKIRYGRLIEF